MDAHRVLGVSPGADRSTIRKAYHKLCLTHHPDKAGQSQEVHETFIRIQQAYKELTEDKEADTSGRENKSGRRERSDEETKPERKYRPRRESPPPEHRRQPPRRPSPPRPSFEEMCDSKWAAEDLAVGIADKLEVRKKTFASLCRWYKRFAPPASYERALRDFEIVDGEFEDAIKEADSLARRIEDIDAVEWWRGSDYVDDIVHALDCLRARAGDCRRKLEVLENTVRCADLAAAKAREWDRTFQEQVSRW